MTNKRILLVEGKDDEHVLKHICGTRGVSCLDEVVPHGNDTQLLQSIPVRLRATSGKGDVVGVVVDADRNVNSRWQSIRNGLDQVGYQNVPLRPKPNGTILEPPRETLLPRTGIWIMPDNQAPGSLETFLRSLVPQPNPLYDHAEDSVRAIPIQLFSQSDEIKAVIHTWLAWQKEPGRPFGTAIKAGFLDPNVQQVDSLVAWLKRLFY